jgi:outer membrane protein assembly factor BamC
MMVALVSGCSWIYGENGLVKSHEYEFVKAELDKPLQVPETLDAPQVVDEFPVPDLPPSASAFPVGKELNDMPPTLLLAVGQGMGVETRIKAPGPTVWFDEREIVMWQAIKDFLAVRGYPVAMEDRHEAILETDWLVEENESLWARVFGSDEPKAVRDKYRFAITGTERGKQKLLTVTNVGHEVLYYGNEQWQREPVSQSRVVEFMNQFLGYWAEQQDLQALRRVEQYARAIELRLGRDEKENPAMIADASFKITWSRLGKVLPVVGFEVDDRDSVLGVYDVSYVGRKGDSSWLSSLAFWSSDEDILDKGEYRFQLSSKGDSTLIRVVNEEGRPLPEDKLKALYEVLEEQFSLRQSGPGGPR